MTDKLIIEGGIPLEGSIKVNGSKNSATPIIAATLLTSEPCVIDNVPLIEDVLKMIDLVASLGAKITWLGERKIKIDNSDINPLKIDRKLVSQMRSSVLVLGPLLARFNMIEMNHPGGCVIGTRGIETHLDVFKQIGFNVEVSQDDSFIQGNYYSEKTKVYKIKKNIKNTQEKIVLDEFSVTATENALMTLALTSRETIIKIAACEPHVQELCEILKKMGCDIEGEGTHTIKITGFKKLKGFEHEISPDYIEAGTFILMGMAVPGELNVENVPVKHLELFFKKLKDSGADFKIINQDSVLIKKSQKLKIKKIQTWTYPGIPTDLQSAFGVLATQAEGSTLIHDPIFDGRLKYLEELNKMGADIIVCDPHRAVINGPTKLYGTELGTLDLRGGAALIIAGLIASGITVIKNVSQVDRGYEKIEERLIKIKASIKREK